MKAKYLIIASLVLAILTIGAVSASEDVAVDDAMATSDITEDPIEETPVDEVIEQSEDSEPLEDYKPEDFNYNAKKSIDLDDEDKVVFNCTLPEEGDINYYVNDEYVSCNVGSSGDFIQIDINDLGIDEPSTYKVKFVFEPSSSQDQFVITEYNLTVTKTYNVNDFDPEWNDDITSKFDDVLEIMNPTKGTLIVSVNGNKRFNATIDDSEYETSVGLSDLNITSNGRYTVSAKFIVNSTSQEVDLGQKTIEVDVDDWNADEYVSISSDANILDSSEDVVYIQDDYVNGTVTVAIDGKEIFSKVITDNEERYDLEITVGDLKLYNNITTGSHTVKVVYMRNGVEKHEIEKSVEFYAREEYVSVSSDVNILVHDCSVVGIEDYDGDVIYGTVTVYIDGVEKFTANIAASEDRNNFKVTVDDLKLYNNITVGNHMVKAVFMRNGVEKHEIEESVDFYSEAYDEYVYISSKVDILSHSYSVVDIEDYDDYLNGTVTVYIDGSVKFTKNIAASEHNDEFYVTVDNLGLYNNIALGKHVVKAVYMRNGVDKHEIENSVEFYANPDFDYFGTISVGEKETLVITYLKSFTGTATLYNAVGDVWGEWIKGNVAGSAKFSNGVATIPFGSLSKGEHNFLVNITGLSYEEPVSIDVRENTPGYSASVSASEITVGSSVVVKFNSPASQTSVGINVDGNFYASVIASGAVSQEIKGLTAGTHKIKVFFDDGDKFYSNTFYVTVKNPTPAKKDTIKLTLKKVKVKKSAKKLVLQATLKINGKAVKGKVIKFKFNKKTYKAKTNKKGVAKVTIKKKVLKKLKVGKKVKIQATYGKTTKKLTVKVKK